MNTFRNRKIGMEFGLILTVASMPFVGVQNANARPIGIDVSSYQGSPNWGSIKSCGWTFAFAKATEGATINDGSYRYNINNAKANGVYVGAYHFAHPEANSPGTESGHFWSVINGDVSNDGKSIHPVLDFEVFSGWVGASGYSDWANQFNNNISNDANGKGVNVNPILYTSSCSVCNFNSSISQWMPWIANYNGQSSQTGTPWSSCSSCDVWDDWTVWQYSDSGSVCGVSGGCDVDVYNGDSTSLVNTLVINGGGTATYAPGPAAVAWGSGRIDVVVRGGGDAIYHKWFISGTGWSGFDNIGGISSYGPAIASWAPNRLDVFCAATDYSLRHKYWDGSEWLPTPHWENIGGTLTSGPAAVSWASNRIDIVCKGGNNNIYHKWWDGSSWQPSGGFENIGGNAQNAPGLASWGPNRLDVFYRGSDNTLQHMWNDGTWHGPQSLGGVLTGGVAACSWGYNRIDVVVRGGNNNIYHKWWDGTGWYPTGGFENLGGTSTSGPGICTWGPGRLDIFCRGTDNALWHNYYTGGAWASWQSLGGVLQ